MMKVTYIGHACFKVEAQGYTVIFDPYADGSVPGYGPVREEADLILCSHEHRDHGARQCVTLKEGGKNPFRITEIATWHDDAKGTLRGNNIICILDDGDLRIAHFGDLGCLLTAEQKTQLQGLDAVMIPVGGHYTIDAKTAKKIVDEICPKVVIPMHYCGDDFGYDVIGPVDRYLELCDDVEIKAASSVDITKDMPAGTVVLKAQNLMTK